MNIPGFLLTLLFCFSSASLLAQVQDSTSVPQKVPQRKDKKVRFTAMALPSRAPENGWYVQGGVIGLFRTQHQDTTLRVSNIYVFGLYSQLHQYRVSLGGDIFTPKEKWYINFWYYTSHYPDYYYGVGSNTSPNNKELIDFNVWHINTNVYRRVKKNTFVGISQWYERVYNLSYPADGIMATDPPVGATGYSVSGFGPRLRYDGRDNILSSLKGAFAEVSWQTFQKWTGSAYNFNWFYVDLRYFKPIIPAKRHILALQYYYSFTGGTVPFRQLSYINTRAYHPNIYRDKICSWMQAEYRFPVWKFIGLSVFGGTAIAASGNDKWFAEGIKPNAGVGLRFRVIPEYNMNLRIEYGVGQNTSSFYIAFYDAF